MKRVLIVPDSIWGNDSGHRSTQFLVKTLKNQGLDVGVYAEDEQKFTHQQDSFLKEQEISFFSKNPYSILDQFFYYKKKTINEFRNVVSKFNPDFVFYFGTIRNKISIDYLNSKGVDIPYIYLPLTNEFWCVKNFAGLKNGECYKCMNNNFLHSLVNNCLDTKNPMPYLKGIIERLNSRKRFLNSKVVLGYSSSQVDTFKMFGLKDGKSSLTNVFFEKGDLDKFIPHKGDYYLISGQITDAKGWHLVPQLLHLNANNSLKFKFIIYRAETAQDFINKNNLGEYIDNGKLEIISGLESHSDVLRMVANSLAIIIPSNYPSTGEFALLEAMGLSKPIVAFDVGAHKNFLTNNYNALISAATDVTKMAKDLEIINENDILWEKLSKNSRLTFEKITSFENNHSLIESLNI